MPEDKVNLKGCARLEQPDRAAVRNRIEAKQVAAVLVPLALFVLGLWAAYATTKTGPLYTPFVRFVLDDPTHGRDGFGFVMRTPTFFTYVFKIRAWLFTWYVWLPVGVIVAITELALRKSIKRDKVLLRTSTTESNEKIQV